MTKPIRSVMGITARAPRPTGTAIWLAVRYIGLPLLAGLVLLDVLIWIVALQIWDTCIGLWCWL